MKKLVTLAEQVREAQKAISKWPTDKQASARLQGTDIYLLRDSRKSSATTTEQMRTK